MQNPPPGGFREMSKDALELTKGTCRVGKLMTIQRRIGEQQVSKYSQLKLSYILHVYGFHFQIKYQNQFLAFKTEQTTSLAILIHCKPRLRTNSPTIPLKPFLPLAYQHFPPLLPAPSLEQNRAQTQHSWPLTYTTMFVPLQQLQ